MSFFIRSKYKTNFVILGLSEGCINQPCITTVHRRVQLPITAKRNDQMINSGSAILSVHVKIKSVDYKLYTIVHARSRQ